MSTRAAFSVRVPLAAVRPETADAVAVELLRRALPWSEIAIESRSSSRLVIRVSETFRFEGPDMTCELPRCRLPVALVYHGERTYRGKPQGTRVNVCARCWERHCSDDPRWRIPGRMGWTREEA